MTKLSLVLVLLGALPAAAQTHDSTAEDASEDTVQLRVLANGDIVPDNEEGRRYQLEQYTHYLSLRRRARRQTSFGLSFGFLSVGMSMAGWLLGSYQCFDAEDDCRHSPIPWLFAVGGIISAAVSFSFAAGGGKRRRKVRKFRLGPTTWR